MEDDAFRRRLEEIAQDRSHGAAELARRGLEIAAESARTAPAADAHALRRLLDQRAAALAAARPSMAPLANLLGRWREALRHMPGDGLEPARLSAAAAAEALAEGSRNAGREAAARAAAYFGAHFGADRTLITHSLSSTVLELFRLLKDAGVRAIVTESRPLFEGRETAARLSRWSIPTTLITDAQLGHFVGQADFAVVGADGLGADGSVVNKAGTYLLALAARDRAVPFHVVCESFKRLGEGAEFELERMDASEMGAPDLPGVTPANVYFDVTPARLISGWFTEEGGPELPAPGGGA